MNTSMNRRYQETEERIGQAFTKLLSVKQYYTITVQDICNHAQISRPSFYSHYDDIHDLLEHMEQEKGVQIQDLLISDDSLSVDSFERYFSFLKENRGFYLAYLTVSDRGTVTNDLMEAFLHTHNISPNDRIHYQMLFFMAGLKSIACRWMLDDCSAPIRLLSQIAYDQYKALFL